MRISDWSSDVCSSDLWHFGPKAQEVWSIFAAHGLAAELVEDASGDLVPPPGSVPPAFLCFDEWGEETAPVLAWWRPSEILGPDGQPVMVQCARSEEHTSELQSLMRISYAVFCLKKKTN